jgi:hypothetical protein
MNRMVTAAFTPSVTVLMGRWLAASFSQQLYGQLSKALSCGRPRWEPSDRVGERVLDGSGRVSMVCCTSGFAGGPDSRRVSAPAGANLVKPTTEQSDSQPGGPPQVFSCQYYLRDLIITTDDTPRAVSSSSVSPPVSLGHAPGSDCLMWLRRLLRRVLAVDGTVAEVMKPTMAVQRRIIFHQYS